ncbi:MAG: hypothetical protein K2N64_01855 [Anaeroplasmataceae bacterium]|nr:hypothetical protein [Anaeroplasmataceae bacterium]
MITIQIAKINIGVDFLFEDQFYNIESFQVDEKEQYRIKSYSKEFSIPQEEPDRKTEFYDIYETDTSVIQVQKNKGAILGAIVYKGNEIDLYLKNVTFVTEYLLSQYALLYILGQKSNALFIHGSSIVYQGKGILFCAKSGTGKSTQASLWRTFTDAVSLNDDKNIIVFEENSLRLYSNPWSGKHQIHQNIVAPLTCVVFLSQARKNRVDRLEGMETMRLLLGQIEPPKKASVENWNTMVDQVLKLPMYTYGCNMKPEAVTILKERLERDLCL